MVETLGDTAGIQTLLPGPTGSSPAGPSDRQDGESTPTTPADAIRSILGEGSNPDVPPPDANDNGISGGTGERRTGTYDGNSSHPRARSRRGRLRSYVSSANTTDPNPIDQARNEANVQLGHRGALVAADFERRNGRNPTIMDHYNEGYDLESKDSAGAIRYIEVKAVTGLWSGDGVGVTSAEFRKAYSEGVNYWLYVVENAETDTPTIHCMHNPALSVNEFMYDDGWRDAAVASMMIEQPGAPHAQD